MTLHSYQSGKHDYLTRIDSHEDPEINNALRYKQFNCLYSARHVAGPTKPHGLENDNYLRQLVGYADTQKPYGALRIFCRVDLGDKEIWALDTDIINPDGYPVLVFNINGVTFFCCGTYWYFISHAINAFTVGGYGDSSTYYKDAPMANISYAIPSISAVIVNKFQHYNNVGDDE